MCIYHHASDPLILRYLPKRKLWYLSLTTILSIEHFRSKMFVSIVVNGVPSGPCSGNNNERSAMRWVAGSVVPFVSCAWVMGESDNKPREEDKTKPKEDSSVLIVSQACQTLYMYAQDIWSW